MINSADCPSPFPSLPCLLYSLHLTQAGVWLHKEAVVIAEWLLQCDCDSKVVFLL